MAKNCTSMISVDQLHFADNVRSDACLQLPQIVESIKRHGFKSNHPLVVSEKEIEGETRYLVLIGNRRGLGLVFLRDNEPDEYNRAFRLLPAGKIPAIVHRHLTVEEEVDLRIDHSADEDRVPLDEWSIFLAIKQLVQVGIDTQERIATKLGLYKARGKEKGQPNRPYVQVRVNLARLPQFVQDQYETLMTEGKDNTEVRFAHIARLYKAYNAEYIGHPEGDGPDFQAAWKEAIMPKEKKESTDSSNGDDAKELSPAEAVKRSQAASSVGLREALLVATRQTDGNLAKIDEAILRGESALATLADIRDYLGEKDYAELLDVSRKQAAEKAPAFEAPHEHVEA